MHLTHTDVSMMSLVLCVTTETLVKQRWAGMNELNIALHWHNMALDRMVWRQCVASKYT